MILIGLLYVVSVPWYRDVDAPLRIVFGVPDWVAVAIGCYAAAACLNAAAWLLSDATNASDESAASSDRPTTSPASVEAPR